jgi:simple sugar transport system ATP-binding protein
VVGTADPATTSTASLARMMVGTAPKALSHPPVLAQGEPRLEAIGLSAPAADPFGIALQDISFTLRGGEILGIAGVSGNGQTELLALLSGERQAAADMVWLASEPVGDLGITERRRRGLAVVPEERLGQATVPEMTLSDNLLLTRQDDFVRYGLIDRRKLKRAAEHIIKAFAVTCGSADASARSLSGGNLQKYIVGREIGVTPAILILAQPTWGVDVAAARFIRQSLIDLSRKGTAILVISEDLDELLDLCDRIAVLQRGCLSRPEANRALDRERIGLLMGGSG